MERPKYLEYRYRRDQIIGFEIHRTVVVTLERPAAAILRLVGKKTSAKRDTYEEKWTMELRVADVRPDYSAPIKVMLTSAQKLVKGEAVPYEGTDPTTEFLNETVDQFGKLTEFNGTLPTPHLVAFPEDPQVTGGEWEQTREENLPVYTPEGRVMAHEPTIVVYRGRIEQFGEKDGVEFAQISFSGRGVRGEEGDPVWQEYTTAGNLRFAIRDGHMLTAEVTRSMAAHITDGQILTTTAQETFVHTSEGTERSVGGMRL